MAAKPAPNPLQVKRAAIARAALDVKCGRGTPEQLEATRSDYATAKLEAYIRELVDSAPPLTADQRRRLAALLTGGPDASA